ncbi:MAG: hypothetical protein EOP34_05430 [Rickettsiales bacterium]|nr:MAG: hypothetical protein EOP34_05430 [Rickettsiales bacterium]
MLISILLIFLLQQINYNYLSCLVLFYALLQSFTYDMKLAYFDSLINFNYFINDSISNSASITLVLLMFWLIISMSQNLTSSVNNKTHPSVSLLVLAVIAIISLAGSSHLISTIVCIEIQSLVMYIVLAFNYPNNLNLNKSLTESNIGTSQFGISYLLNAAVATAFLLLGLSYNQPIIVAIGLL